MAASYRKQQSFGEGWGRLRFMFAVFVCCAAIITARLFSLQVLQHGYYVALAEGQQELSKKLWPKRGSIYGQDTRSGELIPLAMNKEYPWLHVNPDKVTDPQALMNALISIFQIPDEDVDKKNELFQKLTKKGDPSEPLFRKLTDAQKTQVDALNNPALFYINETFRLYPEKQTAAHVVGFLGMSNDQRKGQYGVEGYFDKELAGTSGFINTQRDASGRWIATADELVNAAVDGSDVVLTIDPNIQYFACNKMKEYAERSAAIGGALVILDPSTGAVLAMCSEPEFDPNEYNKVESVDVYSNYATFNAYESGSVMKAITMAAAIDAGVVGPQTTYVDSGEEKIGAYTIRNSDKKANGTQTMTNVLEKSLNTGVIFAMRKTGQPTFKKYLEDFGFGQKTGIQLDTESAGNLASLDRDGEIFYATASFGQGITTTPLQVVDAYATIANNGKRMQPYVVQKINKPDGSVVTTQPHMVKQVISEKSAKTLGAMLVSVVENGHAKRAQTRQYFLAGKTGTAQKPGTDGKYSDKIYATFAGYGPMNNPKFAMVVMFDEPQVEWAEGVAAPVFHDVAQFVLQYYGVPPERESDLKR